MIAVLPARHDAYIAMKCIRSLSISAMLGLEYNDAFCWQPSNLASSWDNDLVLSHLLFCNQKLVIASGLTLSV